MAALSLLRRFKEGEIVPSSVKHVPTLVPTDVCNVCTKTPAIWQVTWHTKQRQRTLPFLDDAQQPEGKQTGSQQQSKVCYRCIPPDQLTDLTHDELLVIHKHIGRQKYPKLHDALEEQPVLTLRPNSFLSFVRNTILNGGHLDPRELRQAWNEIRDFQRQRQRQC